MDKESAQSLAEKLEEFGKSLDPPEQEALDTVVRTFADTVEDRIAAVETLTPEDEKELDPVREALAKRGEPEAIFPLTAITVTTATTALQTSRWLCR